jgi:hypothetical protein
MDFRNFLRVKPLVFFFTAFCSWDWLFLLLMSASSFQLSFMGGVIRVMDGVIRVMDGVSLAHFSVYRLLIKCSEILFKRLHKAKAINRIPNRNNPSDDPVALNPIWDLEINIQ